MKVACVLVICLGLFSASHAQATVDFGDLKDLGQSLLDNLVEQGKKVIKDTATDILGGLLSKVGDLVGKRDLSKFAGWATDLAGKLQDLAEKGKQVAGSVFSDTVEKLKSLTETYTNAIGSIKDAAGIVSHIDSVVAEHSTRQKRVIDTLVQTGKQLIAGAVEKAKGAAAMLKKGASALVSGLLQKGVDIFGKRSLTDNLSAIGDALSKALGPLSDAVSGVGDTLKGHFSNLVDTVKGHATALKTKLDPHLDELKGHGSKLVEHGKNAISALSEVVGDILNQTVSNAGDSLSGASDALVDAGKTVVDHFTGNDAVSSQ